MGSAAVFFGVREASKPCATELENRCIGLAFIGEFGALLPILLPITPISGAKVLVWPRPPTADIKYVLQCGNAKSVPPDDDSDPVLLTRIVAIADAETRNGEIYIRHFVASGENYTRNKQYRDLRFWSEGNADYWSGTSVKYPDRTMVGRIGIHSKRQWIEYVEKHYQGGKLESTTTFACRPIKPEIRDEDWKEGGRKS